MVFSSLIRTTMFTMTSPIVTVLWIVVSRHWYERGGARASDPDPRAVEGQEHARHGEG